MFEGEEKKYPISETGFVRKLLVSHRKIFVETRFLATRISPRKLLLSRPKILVETRFLFLRASAIKLYKN